MVQALFAVVFVSVLLPVFLQLYREGKSIEAALNRLGMAGKIFLALLFVGIAAAQAKVLPTDSFFGPILLLDNVVFEYLFLVPIHETGHFLFMPLGTDMSYLGGSLLQVCLPAIFSFYFLSQRLVSLGSIFLFLTGRHMVQMAQYMESAHNPSSVLLLSLDQNPETHDWFHLFSKAGLLNYDTTIAMGTRVIAYLIISLALVSLFVPPDKEEPAEGLNQAGDKAPSIKDGSIN